LHFQSLALQTLGSLTSLFKDRAAADHEDGHEDEAVLVEQGGENLVLCLGNLLNSASQKTATELNQPEEQQTQVLIKTIRSCSERHCLKKFRLISGAKRALLN